MHCGMSVNLGAASGRDPASPERLHVQKGSRGRAQAPCGGRSRAANVASCITEVVFVFCFREVALEHVSKLKSDRVRRTLTAIHANR